MKICQRKPFAKLLLLGMTFMLTAAPAAVPTSALASDYAGATISGHAVKYATMNMKETQAKVMLANGAINSAQALKGMAEANGAFAAINGTYFSAYDGNPIPWGTVMRDGKLLHTGGGAVMGITADGRLLVDRLNFAFKGYVNGEEKFVPWRINHDCDAADAIVVYTSEYSGTIKPLTGAKVVLVGRDGKVSSFTTSPFTVPGGGFAIIFNQKVANMVDERFKVGDSVTYTYEYKTTYTNAEDWKKVTQALGAGPSLIINGVVTADGKAEGFTQAKINTNRAGRSFIGSTADGKIVIGNIGSATLKEAAQVCQSLSLTNAMCLDGGGSIALYYNGSKAAGRNINNGLGFFENPIRVYLNGAQLSFPQAPYVANDTTMVPMRAIFEALGAGVDYDSATKRITAKKGDSVVELVLGQKTAKINGTSSALGVPAVTKNDSTMVPLRFVSEALQATVNWDNATRTITIETK